MKLIQYIKGLRKGKDAHRIERDAMADPFLADALEGFDLVDDRHAERIERMQRRVTLRSQKEQHAAARIAAKKRPIYAEASEVMMDAPAHSKMATEEQVNFVTAEERSTNKKKRRSLIVWTAAAILLLFIATGGYFWLLKEDQMASQLAVVNTNTAAKDAPPATEDKVMQSIAEQIDLTESDDNIQNQDYQRSRTIEDEQRRAPIPAATIPPSTIADATLIEEKQELADEKLSSSYVLDGLLDNRFSFNTEIDSVLNLNKFKLEDSTSSNYFAFKDSEKSQLSGSISTIDVDDIGIYSNTNRHALSQKEKAYDQHALSQSQLLSQGKIGGRLADQSQSSYLDKAEKRKKKQASASISADKPSPQDAVIAENQKGDSYYISSQASGNVKGRVVDQNGEPIPFVTVQIKGTTTATATDIEGYFALNAQNAEKLVASYIGFDTVELPVDTSKSVTIAMNESTALLEEMVVTAYGRNVADDSYSYQAPTVPEPEAGYSSYRKYLNDNLIRPTDECSDAKGRVTLTFYVNSSGYPYNIQVKRSLCPSADREAIRLIEEGGRWTRGDGEVRINVKF